MSRGVSIIIVTYHHPEMIRLCLRALMDHPPSSSYEIIVVDSHAQRETRDIIIEETGGDEHFTYLPYKDNLGYPRAVNIGISRARGQYFVILNYDVLVTHGAIDGLVEYLERHPDVGLVGPQLRHFNGRRQESIFRFYSPLTLLARRSPLRLLTSMQHRLDHFAMRDVDSNRMQTPDWLMGSALCTTRQAVERVGLMDERFFMYFEDVDWARRFWHNGYKVVYLPSLTMFHYLGQGSKSGAVFFDILRNRKTRWHVASAIKFFWKYRSLSRTVAP